MSASKPRVAVALLGTGVVGSAFVELLQSSAATSVQLVATANSRSQQVVGGPDGPRDDEVLLAALRQTGAAASIVVDATASPEVGRSHPEWLRRGFGVVTANKSLAGGSAKGWRALIDAGGEGCAYGDAATVGAGLPAIATVRRLRACGDKIVRLEGVFSGSLSWLFSNYTGEVEFSRLLNAAREAGYTEPDPRLDLSGQDVARKLLILARAAGFDLEPSDIRVRSLVPEQLRDVETPTFLQRAGDLDVPMREQLQNAQRDGRQLRYLASLTADGVAEVGLRAVAPDHPTASLRGTDNLFAFTTDRYPRALVIQGAGAGPKVTAQALLADVLEIAAARRLGPVPA